MKTIKRTLNDIELNQVIDYDAIGNIEEKDQNIYKYYSQRPHAVEDTGDTVYYYDANGNLDSDSSGRKLEWSYYNKPTIISRGSTEIQFAYGPDRARYQKIWSNGDREETTTYIGGVYEYIEKDYTSISRFFIQVAGQMVAIEEMKCSDCADPTVSTQWHFKDHLGSVDTIVTHIEGRHDEYTRQSYDAFGLRRAEDWNFGEISDMFSQEPRGFTGHEHLDDVGLIHMNGRVYDPQLGRFLSADPYIQFPKNMQSYNRYSYVLNNPLSHTDPSGHFAFLAAFAVNVGIAAGQMAMAAGFSSTFAAGVFYVTTAAVYGASMGVISGVASMAMGGTFADGFQSGLMAGVTGATFGFIGATSFDMSVGSTTIGLGDGITVQRIIAHGIVGGTTTRINGGQFRDGFVSGAFTKSVSGYIKVFTQANPGSGIFVAAVVGGTASELAGGKFSNGAFSAAFGYLYNELSKTSRAKLAKPWQEDDNWSYQGQNSSGIPTGQMPPPNSFGAHISLSTINPITSDHGRIIGGNIQDNIPYKFVGDGIGYEVDLSFESVWAWGSGSWEGPFNSFALGAGPLTGSVFWSDGANGASGWLGITYGMSIGPPTPDMSYQETNYTIKETDEGWVDGFFD